MDSHYLWSCSLRDRSLIKFVQMTILGWSWLRKILYILLTQCQVSTSGSRSSGLIHPYWLSFSGIYVGHCSRVWCYVSVCWAQVYGESIPYGPTAYEVCNDHMSWYPAIDTSWNVSTAKIQFNLCTRTVWSESLVFNLKKPWTLAYP